MNSRGRAQMRSTSHKMVSLFLRPKYVYFVYGSNVWLLGYFPSQQ